MALEYIPFYYSYRKKIEKLSDQEVGRLVRALLEYGEAGEAEELTGRESIAFDFIADDIDRAKKSYEDKCTKNRANSMKRHEKETDVRPNTTEYDRIQSNTTVYESYQTKDKDKDKDKNKDKDNISPSNDGRDTRAVRATSPTVDEVKAYAQEKGLTVDPQAFWDYFDAGDWVDSEGKPVRNWKQKMLTWAKYEPKKGGNSRNEQPNYQPTAARVRKNSDRLKQLLAEQGDKP